MNSLDALHADIVCNVKYVTASAIRSMRLFVEHGVAIRSIEIRGLFDCKQTVSCHSIRFERAFSSSSRIADYYTCP